MSKLFEDGGVEDCGLPSRNHNMKFNWHPGSGIKSLTFISKRFLHKNTSTTVPGPVHHINHILSYTPQLQGLNNLQITRHDSMLIPCSLGTKKLPKQTNPNSDFSAALPRLSFCVVELLSTPMCALPIMQSSNPFPMLFKALVCLDPGSGKSEAKNCLDYMFDLYTF